MAGVYSYVTYQLLPLLFTSHRPLLATRCFLRVAYFQLFHSNHFAARAKEPVSQSSAVRPRPSANFENPSAPKRNSPAQAPRHTVFAIPYAKLGALRRGGLGGGCPRGTGLSGGGQPLQGLLLWRNSLPKGPAPGKVPGVGGLDGGPASSRGTLHPRSSPLAGCFSGGVISESGMNSAGRNRRRAGPGGRACRARRRPVSAHPGAVRVGFAEFWRVR